MNYKCYCIIQFELEIYDCHKGVTMGPLLMDLLTKKKNNLKSCFSFI